MKPQASLSARSCSRKSPRFALSLLVVLLMFTSGGCGKKGVGGLVSGAQFSTTEENGDLFGNLNVLLSTGGVLLPSFDLPILNPKNPGAIYGTISMRDALSAGTQLGISVNLSEISGLEGADGSLLPNGRAIPVFLGAGVRPLSVAVSGRSRVYFAFSEGTAVIGTAIVIPEFDKIASYVGAVDLFFPFQGENGVRGAAGLFSSPQSGQSGIAVFVDASSVLQQVPEKSMNRMLARVASKSSSASSIVSSVSFRTQGSMGSMQAYRLSQFMGRLSSSGRRLGLQ